MEFTIEKSIGNYYYIFCKVFGSTCWLTYDGIITASCTEVGILSWKTKQEAQQFLDNWLPQKDWLTEEHIKEQAKISECAALDCSIEHYKQILLVGYDEFIVAESVSIGLDYCAMCQRIKFLFGKTHGNCKKCLLCKEGDLCHNDNEWVKLRVIIYGNQSEGFDEAVIAVLNKLIEIRNKKYGRKTMEKMIDVRGKKVSESTVVEALKEHCGFEEKVVEKEHIFKAGEVVDFGGLERFMIEDTKRRLLYAVDKHGLICNKKKIDGVFGANYKYLGKLNSFNYSGMDVVE